MADKTAIAWTDHTFNAWIGCHKVSQGCKHCYAEPLVKDRMGEPDRWGAHGTRRRTSAAYWRKPVRWNLEAREEGRPRRVFCCSLADVFEDRPELKPWRRELFELIRQTRWLDWQLLTKRPENFESMLPDDWSVENYPNVWLGTSIEDYRVRDRARDLLSVPAVVHFVSYEPAIGPLNLSPWLDDIEWMIVGGESGPDFRPMDLDWAREMQDDCKRAGTAFFFKQNSARRTELGIDALGQVYRDYPLTWDRDLERALATRELTLMASVAS